MNSNISEKSIKQLSIDYIKKILSNKLQISNEYMDDDTGFYSLGLDSIIILGIIEKMEDDLGVLPKTLFFEYPTIEDMADFIAEKYGSIIKKLSKIKKDKAQNAKLEEDTQNSKDNIKIIKKEEKKEISTNSSPKFRFFKTTQLVKQETKEVNSSYDIAIIGVSGKYPMARNLDEFWENLRCGKDCISEIPQDRWNYKPFYSPNKTQKSKSYLKNGGFMDGVYEFDPLFFSISPKEAMSIDPQERLFLECAYETLEDAGYMNRRRNDIISNGNVGVFVGSMWQEYQLYGAQEQILGNPVYMSGSLASIANRVSYYFNFNGPSVGLDTMCSSSLTALHMACQSILLGDCEVAIVGGVNINVHPNKFLHLSQGKFASSKGACMSFGEGGDGYVPGEGVGAILLKPLNKAIKDKDNIYAVVKSTSINHGGRTNYYSVPNPNAQASVIETALKKSGINPRAVSYVESHGTGTSLGDPIEILGLTKAYEKFTKDKQFCAIGALKSNIGHLEGAAGIAGLIKVILQMKHKEIVPSLHSENLNPYIDFKNSPFWVARNLKKWERPVIEVDGEKKEYPRIAGISAFGAGGVNTHVILEEYICRNIEKQKNKYPNAIILSARSEEQLKISAKQLYEKIEQEYGDDLYLPSIAYILQTGREYFDYRVGFIVSNINELKEKLSNFINGREDSEILIKHIKQANKNIQEDSFDEITDDIGNMAKAMLKSWMCNGNPDWNKLYKEKPYKISLPSYPFARETYFAFDRVKQYISNGSIAKISLENENKIEEIEVITTKENKLIESKSELESTMTFSQSWVPENIKIINESKKVVVCFVSDVLLKSIISQEIKLINSNIEVIWINIGEKYAKLSNNSYEIVYEEFEDYKTAFKDIFKNYKKIDEVLYPFAILDKIYLKDKIGILYLIQALSAEQKNKTEIILPYLYEDAIDYSYAEAMIGIEKSIKMSTYGVSFKVILGNRNEYSNSEFISIVLKEMYAHKPCSVLYENNIRKILKVIPIELKNNNISSIKESGTYIITGGAGGLGMIFAKFIREKYNANLILTGRKKKNELENIKEIEKMGNNVIYIQADVTKESDMKHVIEIAKKYFGCINGIIHAAGIEQEKSVLKKKANEYQSVLAPKIDGTLAIDRAIEKEDLDFICYFSSSSAIIGDFGFCDYAEANRFLMAYAHCRNVEKRLPGKAIVINWSLWKDGGMGGANEESNKMYLKTSGLRLLEIDESIKLFEEILKDGREQCLVISGNKEKVYNILGIENSNNINSNDTLENLYGFGKIEKELTNHNRQGRGWRRIMKGWTIQQCIEWNLKKLIMDILSITENQIDEEMNLADYGFDSVTLSEFAERISKNLDIKVTPDIFYSYSTINALTEYISTNYSEKMKEFFNKVLSEDIKQIDVSPKEENKKLEEYEHINSFATKETLRNKDVKTKEIVSNKLLEEPIAIVGISGKFPGADNTDELWEILESGKEVIDEVPREREEWYDGSEYEKNQKIGYVKGIDLFDTDFFEISPREAKNMDPRQRLLLEETWKALEDAGFGSLEKNIGMFVGAEDGDYKSLENEKSTITGNHNAIMSARISYFLNLQGPNMSINTACSSGLVAVHQACQSLRTNECETAIAAGVNIFSTPIGYREMDKAGMISSDRRCYAFDKRANGMVPAEAVAVVVLKRLSDAEKDRDRIYGVIRGSGINYDGKTNGITAPSGQSQARLIKDVYKKYDINSQDIDYIVTHGTGTRIGDPIEINALVDAFKGRSIENKLCALTSTKSNLGHSLAASGVVSLISLIKAMEHEIIPASINISEKSDYVDWENIPFFINTKNLEWKNENGKKVGAVNAFGMSGTNVHVVVESYDKNKKYKRKKYPYYLLALSAKTPQALKQKCVDMIKYLSSNNSNMEDISYTLIDRRKHFTCRLAIVVADKETAIQTLKQVLSSSKLVNVYENVVDRNFKPQLCIQNMVNKLCEESLNNIDNVDEYRKILNSLAEMYCYGYLLSGDSIFEEDTVKITSIPYYPFNNKRYWVDRDIKKKVVEEKEISKVEDIKNIQARTLKNNTIILPSRAKEILDFKDIGKEISKSLAKELYIEYEDIDWNKPFLEIGLDSIIGVEWINKINKDYGLSISTTKLYQYPNIIEFAQYIFKEISLLNKEERKESKKSDIIVQDIVEENYEAEEGVYLEDLDNDIYNKDIEENFNEYDTTIVLEEPKIVNEENKESETNKVKPSIKLSNIAEELASMLSKELYIEKKSIDYDKSFTEMGVDSIIGVEWINAINKKFGIKVESTKIYQYPNITEFTKYLIGQIENKVEDTQAESVDINEILEKVYKGEIDMETAEKLIHIEGGTV